MSSERDLRRARRLLVAVAMLAAVLVIVTGAVLLYWRTYLLGPSAGAFTRGPYLTRVEATRAEVRYRVRGSAAVELRATARDGRSVVARDDVFTDLDPGTAYAWTAAVDGVVEAHGSFTTAPTALDRPLRFAVIGDYGSGDEHEWAVGRVLAAFGPGLIVTAGDNSYLVAADEFLDRNLFRPLAEVMRSAPLHPGLGDHDLFPPGPGALAVAFDIPEDGRYVVRYGPLQIVELGDESDAAALTFARAALAEPGPVVRFLVLHKPLRSGDPLLALSRERGVEAIFAGHLHRYERRPLDGVPTFTVGNGGQGPGNLEFTKATPEAVVSLLDIGALIVDVDPGGTVTYSMVDERGRILDRSTS